MAVIDDNAQEAIKNHLLPLADIVTPNLPEASALLDKNIQNYTPRMSAYDLKKLRGKNLVEKTHAKSRRYQSSPDGLRTMSGLVVLRQKVIEPLLKYLGRCKGGNLPKQTAKIDQYFRDIQHTMSDIFKEFHFAGEYTLNKVLAIKARAYLSTKVCR